MKLIKIELRGALLSVLLLLSACGQKPADFSLTLGGDIMLARDGEPIFMEDNTPIDPWKEIADNLERSNDTFLANLESPLGKGITSDEMNLCSDPGEIEVLQQGGLDLLTLANNHRDDCQPGGDFQTGVILEENGILSARAGGEPVILDSGHGKIAVIAVDAVSTPVEIEPILEQITFVKQDVQVVLVSIHWGMEYQTGAEQAQQQIAQQLADAGADVIWGHHPHVLQPMAWLQASDGRQVLVLYSLGNLSADQWMLESAQRSALVRLSYRDGKLSQVEIMPVSMNHSTKTLEWVSDQGVQQVIFDQLGVDELSNKGVEIVVR